MPALITSSAGKMGLYVDGKRQRIKVSKIAKAANSEVIIRRSRDYENMGFDNEKDHEWRRKHRFNIAVGHDRKGANKIQGMIDELRLSDIVRYSRNFKVPNSFSYAYGPGAPKPAMPNGPPLLFAQDSPKGTVKLGGRKHLFIDEAIIDSKQNIKFNCNSPFDRRELNFGPDKSAWRASVMDVDGKVYMYIPEGYGSSEGMTRLRVSEDGINFIRPKLGVIEYKGSKDNEFVFGGQPFYGSFFRDLNPGIDPQEQYKMTAWLANRGIYMFMSPDGIHWRRSQSCMLPLVSGGGAETYWDDQRGVYVDFIKRDSSYKTKDCPGSGRRASMFETKEMHKTWPFTRLEVPYFEGWPMTAVTCEGPIIFSPNKNGQVYRTRAIKYPWAPDVYLAFVWRYEKTDQRRQVDLGVSRDGINWKLFADEKWYATPGEYEEVLSLYGIIRRGDEIWQYFDYGGAHGGDKKRLYARLTQRLDGFVSIDTSGQAGTIVTRPLIFDGNKLVLNINAKGSAKVAILDEQGGVVKGFGIADCDTIKGDSTRHVVTWNSSSEVSKLTGKVVRVKFEMQNTKLFAMQFAK
ncbi:MAG: hypothetical protein ACYTBV_16060 [Planctomycetota bacterium]